MRKRYALGIDFGTDSARALLVDVTTGKEVATVVFNYPHGVLDEVLPDRKTKLGPDWALQHPGDYLEALRRAVPAVLRKAKAKPEEVIGIGVDFTSCTMMPVDEEGTPLCLKPEFKSNPHAWVKLWKHHAAQPDAVRLIEVAQKRGEKFLARYGGTLNCEWFFPKILQTLREAPEVYDAAARFIEGADWMVFQLTGVERRSSCNAGYKAFWSKEDGFPSEDFFREVNPRLADVRSKISQDIYPVGSRAGELRPEMAKSMGLKHGTPVAVGVIDAHSAVPGAGVTEPGTMVLVMGTSLCHMVLSPEMKMIPGIAGVVADGIVPGYYGYEAGQPAVGDIFAWFVERCVLPEYHTEARKKHQDVHGLVIAKASKLRPGETGLVALDWWNGNRSVLMNADLSGVIVGLTLGTKAEEIYRALLESTAFGTRKIIETMEREGIAIRELRACGGLAERNKLLMQIFADVTGREITLAASPQTTALGAAMWGAVAAGKAGGGYDTIFEAAQKMTKVKREKYTPVAAHCAVYDSLYQEYVTLHDYFGRGGNDVMRRLKAMRKG